MQDAWRQAGGAQRPVVGRGGVEANVRVCLRLGEVLPAEARRRGLDRVVHHLQMLRSKLTFDQIVGANIQYGEDRSTVQLVSIGMCSALCSNQVMRCGRHFAVFTMTGSGTIALSGQ